MLFEQENVPESWKAKKIKGEFLEQISPLPLNFYLKYYAISAFGKLISTSRKNLRASSALSAK